jgi:polysaccharide export outer membrane protein
MWMRWLMTVLVFASAAPAQTPAAPALQPRVRYALRAGDSVTLDYRYTPEFNQTVTLQPDGYVDLALLGSVHAAGLTLDQLHDLIVKGAGARLKDPELTLSLKEFERPYFAVAGEVEHPGRLDFYEKTTALQAILLAGGFKGTAQQSNVYLFRKVDGNLTEVHELNLKHIRNNRDLERDLILQPGDIVLVPRNKLENLSRFMKSANLSIYFDPLTYLLTSGQLSSKQ